MSPGLVATEMTTLNKDILPEAKEMFDKIAILQPADVVDAVVYALSTPEHVQVSAFKVSNSSLFNHTYYTL